MQPSKGMINEQENKVGAERQFPISSRRAKIYYQCCHFVILKLKRVHLKANDAYHFVDSKANGYSNKWISVQRKAYLFFIAHARKVKSLKVRKLNR